MNFSKYLLKEVILLSCCALLLFLGYWAAGKFPLFTELTRHSLCDTTKTLLTGFNQELRMTLYTQDVDMYHTAEILIKRYQRLQPRIQFRWQQRLWDPTTSQPHVLTINYGKQQQRLELEKGAFNENQLTQALFKLQRKENQWVVFLQGHDEPDPFGKANKDFSLFRLALENQGIKIQRLNLSLTPFIPNNTQVLILAAPKSALLPKEKQLITSYIEKGGDLLWLIDPDSYPIDSLSHLVGIAPLPGTIVDLHGQKLGTPHPAITVINHYNHLPFQAPGTVSAFPWAVALQQTRPTHWQFQPLLTTHKTTWTETGALEGPIEFEPGKNEKAGPLLLGASLTRTHPLTGDKQQRILIIGNSRFLSNGAIENYGNLALGLNALNWLCHDDALINITQPITQDTLLQIHLRTAILIQYALPAINFFLLFGGIAYFLYRRALSNKIASQRTLQH